jgi:hypothetical protein
MNLKQFGLLLSNLVNLEMPLSTDITLPAEIEPIYPDRCVVCDGETTNRIRISVGTQSPLLSFLVPIMSLFGWKKIAFPTCKNCTGKFYRQRWIRTAICWTIIAVVVYFCMPYFKGVDRTATKLALIAIALAAIVPNIIFELCFPRWFDVTESKHTTCYEFRSEDYATDFYALNRDAYPEIEIRIDDEPV